MKIKDVEDLSKMTWGDTTPCIIARNGNTSEWRRWRIKDYRIPQHMDYVFKTDGEKQWVELWDMCSTNCEFIIVSDLGPHEEPNPIFINKRYADSILKTLRSLVANRIVEPDTEIENNPLRIKEYAEHKESEIKRLKDREDSINAVIQTLKHNLINCVMGSLYSKDDNTEEEQERIVKENIDLTSNVAELIRTNSALHLSIVDLEQRNSNLNDMLECDDHSAGASREDAEREAERKEFYNKYDPEKDAADIRLLSDCVAKQGMEIAVLKEKMLAEKMEYENKERALIHAIEDAKGPIQEGIVRLPIWGTSRIVAFRIDHLSKEHKSGEYILRAGEDGFGASLNLGLDYSTVEHVIILKRLDLGTITIR